MFEFISSDMRKPLPETIEDLVKWDYTVVLMEGYEEFNDLLLDGRAR